MQIKSYTDLKQSKVLAEILPLESADMMYHSIENEYGSGAFVATSKVITNGVENDDFYIDDIPCWSLAALLEVLPNKIGWYYKTIGWFDGAWHCDYMDEDSECKYFSAPCDNPVDACYEMILKLNELNLL